jgi:hypothetical protein
MVAVVRDLLTRFVAALAAFWVILAVLITSAVVVPLMISLVRGALS